MTINIITPETTLYEGEIIDAKLIGLDGSFEILNNHAPIVSALKKGKITIIDTNHTEHSFQINGGLLEMSHNKIQILAQ